MVRGPQEVHVTFKAKLTLPGFISNSSNFQVEGPPLFNPNLSEPVGTLHCTARRMLLFSAHSLAFFRAVSSGIFEARVLH